MGKMKKFLAAGVICYVAYKLGKKYLKENNMTAEDVFDSAKKKAEEFAKQAAGVVPTTKDGEPAGKKSTLSVKKSALRWYTWQTVSPASTTTKRIIRLKNR